MAKTVALPTDRGNRISMLFAVFLAGLTGVLVLISLNNASKNSNLPASGATVGLVVARRDIPARTKLTADMVELREVPGELQTTGALTNLNDAIGGIASVPILRGEQIARSKLAAPAKEGLGLAYVVPDGLRAMSIKIDKVAAAGGLIRPGDRVDIVGTLDVRYREAATVSNPGGGEGSQTLAFLLAQNITVLAVEQSIENRVLTGDKATDSSTASADQPDAVPNAQVITLALTPEQTQAVLLSETKGTLRLALRGPQDTEILDFDPATNTSRATGATGEAVGR